MRLLIWGTGSRAEELLANHPELLQNVVAFVDSNPTRQGGEFKDKPVLSPEAAAAMTLKGECDKLFIASCYLEEITEKARELGFPEAAFVSPCFFHFLKYVKHLTPEQFETLTRVPWWYHRFEILPGVITPGICHYKPNLLASPLVQDLTGWKALDIGAWDGPYTLEMTRRGAQVTGFDIQPPSHSGFNTTCRLNELEGRHFCANVYHLNPETHGTYDLVTFFGVYYHLKNPLAALANINNVLKMGGLLLVEGAVLEGAPRIDAYWADKADLIERMKDAPVAFYAKGDYEGEWSNWWVPNSTCLRHWLESSGFEILESGRYEDDTRISCVCRKIADIPEEHIVLPAPPQA